MDRLSRAHDFSRRRLEPFRKSRLKALKQYVGMHYSENGSDSIVPLNMIKLATTIYLRHLIARTPRCLVTTKNTQAKLLAMAMEQWINDQLVEQQVERTLRLIALDAIFSVGIAKVGLCAGGEIEYGGQTHTYGMPFVDPIDLDDWVHDMNVKRRDQVSFCGNRYRIPLEAAKSNKDFDAKARDELSATYFQRTNEAGDERVETLTHDVSSPTEDFEEFCELWELWLPRDQVIVTIQANVGGSLSHRALRIQPWAGPKMGPFHWLDFNPVPGQTMPSAPVHDMLDMHDLINRMMIKCGEQGERQKTITAVQGTADQDGNRILEAEDGQMIRIDFPQGTKEMRFGGVDQPNMAFLMQCKELFSYVANNMDAIGGLSPQAQTLGQDQMLTANATKTIQAMQEEMITFTKSVLTSLAWYYWADPLRMYHTNLSVPGHPDISAQVNITPEMRQAAILHTTFDIDPYSLQHPTPSQRVQAISQLCQGFLFPGMQAMASQGVGINWNNLVRKLGKYMNIPDLDDIVMFQNPAIAQQAQAGPQPSMPAPPSGGKPNGQYVRHNVTSPKSQAAQMMTAMLQNSGRNQ